MSGHPSSGSVCLSGPWSAFQRGSGLGRVPLRMLLQGRIHFGTHCLRDARAGWHGKLMPEEVVGQVLPHEPGGPTRPVLRHPSPAFGDPWRWSPCTGWSMGVVTIAQPLRLSTWMLATNRCSLCRGSWSMPVPAHIPMPWPRTAISNVESPSFRPENWMVCSDGASIYERCGKSRRRFGTGGKLAGSGASDHFCTGVENRRTFGRQRTHRPGRYHCKDPQRAPPARPACARIMERLKTGQAGTIASNPRSGWFPCWFCWEPSCRGSLSVREGLWRCAPSVAWGLNLDLAFPRRRPGLP